MPGDVLLLVLAAGGELLLVLAAGGELLLVPGSVLSCGVPRIAPANVE